MGETEKATKQIRVTPYWHKKIKLRAAKSGTSVVNTLSNVLEKCMHTRRKRRS